MVSQTHLVEKTIDSINGLMVDQPTDPYHRKNTYGINGLSQTHFTLQNSWLSLTFHLMFFLFSTKDFDLG